MSTSDRNFKVMRNYGFVTLGCLIFAVIYAQFSHGVYSPFMSWMFAIPLLAGVLPAAVCVLLRITLPHTTRQLWALTVATFTIASCLRGIFEIAGTGSGWLYLYVVVGAILAVVSVVQVVVSLHNLKGYYHG